MKVRVIDFETTDSDKAKKAGKPVGIIQIGFTDVTDAGTILPPVQHFVNPGLPISPEARAVHHIADEDIVGAMSPDAACSLLMSEMEPGDIFSAHNAPFERMFFSGGMHDWICTLACAKHIYPDAASHSNQALRYSLGVDAEFEWPDLAMPPHRAGPDTYVTAHILRRMMQRHTLPELIGLTRAPVLLRTVTFGKHEGTLWADLDDGFLRWVLDKDFDADVKHTARHWLARRGKNNRDPFGR